MDIKTILDESFVDPLVDDNNKFAFAENIVEFINKSLSSEMGSSQEVYDSDLTVDCKDPDNLSLPRDYFRGFFPNYNDKNAFWKIFWSGWPQGSQKIACDMAKNITKNYMDISLCDPDSECGGRAVELTNLSKPWMDMFGNFNQEFEILNKYLKDRGDVGNTEKIASELRKNVWDILSREYAEYKSQELPTYALVILPLYLPSIDSEDSFLEKTLLKIELPSLYCDRFSILFFSENGKFYKLNESGFIEVNIDVDTPLKLDIELINFDENVRGKIINFLTKVYQEQKRIGKTGSFEVIKSLENLFVNKSGGGNRVTKKYKKTKNKRSRKKKSKKRRSKKRKTKKRKLRGGSSDLPQSPIVVPLPPIIPIGYNLSLQHQT